MTEMQEHDSDILCIIDQFLYQITRQSGVRSNGAIFATTEDDVKVLRSSHGSDHSTVVVCLRIQSRRCSNRCIMTRFYA